MHRHNLFAYTNADGIVKETDGQCGCLTAEHSSCFETSEVYDLYPTERAISYSFEYSTNTKLIIKSDNHGSGGAVSLQWQCRTQPGCQVAESELSQCLDQFAGSIQFDGRSFEVVSLDRLMYNPGPMRFYRETGGDEFIYFDGQYDQWRIGGASESTQAVDCTTLPVCA